MTIFARIARAFPRALAIAAIALAALGSGAEPAAGGSGGGGAYHILQKGETLYSVARTYGLSPDAIARANSVSDPAKLRIGTKLLIPAVHRVAKGETLFGIARSYGVTLEDLRAANGLSGSSVIKPGDAILLPAGAAKEPPKDPKAPAAPPAAAPSFPDSVRISAKPVDAKASWPCPGEISYLDGKAYGVVIKTKDGEKQKAVASGTVTFADVFRGYGRVVMIVSKAGYTYVYGGNDTISVQAGDRVKSGQEIGKTGLDAKHGGSVAYFLVSKDGEAVDPASAPRD
jgi:lipoprotein YgeR